VPDRARIAPVEGRPLARTEDAVARQSHDRRNTDDTDADDTEMSDLDVLDDDPDAGDEAAVERDPDIEAFWAAVRAEPVEIALPTGSGFTLRAYRPADELSPPEIERDEDDDLFAPQQVPDEDDEIFEFDDEEELARQAERAGREQAAEGRRTRGGAGARGGRDEVNDEEDEADDALDDNLDDDAAAYDDAALADEAASADDVASVEEEDEADEADEVPVFLGHRGRLLLFRTPESLVEFVRSGAPNDLTQLDSWGELAERIHPQDVVPREEDSYELDLVVENLRGGQDAWDPDLLIGAGEVTRDLGYALRLEPILTALAPGSPLDDLDEALRATVSGGLGGFFARRRLRKIGAQQATLGWRTIIGKISGVVDWRD
jgi:hypothetical protein